MLTGFYAEGLASEGFTVIPIHPGFVTTDMNTNTDPEVYFFSFLLYFIIICCFF